MIDTTNREPKVAIIIYICKNHFNMKMEYLQPQVDWTLLEPEYALMDTYSGNDPEGFVDGGEMEW